LPDSLLTDDMTAWLTTQGPVSKAAYQGAIRLFARMAQSPIRFTVDAITAQDDRVVIEAHSQATLINGAEYGNTYVFSLRVRDGRIAWIAEHFNPLIAQEKLIPLAASLR
jgi:ketosteroid isomerase-like protein